MSSRASHSRELARLARVLSLEPIGRRWRKLNLTRTRQLIRCEEEEDGEEEEEGEGEALPSRHKPVVCDNLRSIESLMQAGRTGKASQRTQ